MEHLFCNCTDGKPAGSARPGRGCTSASPPPLPAAQAPASGALHERRWRLAVAAGLLVGPFFPASNVLFYVGTFIGERLLYFPSGKLGLAPEVRLCFGPSLVGHGVCCQPNNYNG